jgi:anti-anti-sigma factor
VNPLVLVIPESATSSELSAEEERGDEHRLLRQLEKKIQGLNRPRLVLDCSKLSRIGIAEIRLLVACLESVMKHNGDARLAAVPPNAEVLLSYTRADRLFQIYPSREDAISSFVSQPDITSSSSARVNGVLRTYVDAEAAGPVQSLQRAHHCKRGGSE